MPLDPNLSLPHGLAGRINPICDRFESELMEGKSPQLEVFLVLVNEKDQPALLRELLALELHYRNRRSEIPVPQEYSKRLPRYADAVRDVFKSVERHLAERKESDLETGDLETGQMPRPSTASYQPYHKTQERKLSQEPYPTVAGYEIIGVLGRGGMGVVYKANHLALKRTVALKMILGGGHAGEIERQRFRTEAEAVARLQHPNIVQVYEVGEHEGLPYCSLEFVDAGSLNQELGKKSLTSQESAILVETLAKAIHLAHSRNIIHRDLKPANILLTSAGIPKVTDFGLARQLDADSGQTAHWGCNGDTQLHVSGTGEWRDQDGWSPSRRLCTCALFCMNA